MSIPRHPPPPGRENQPLALPSRMTEGGLATLQGAPLAKIPLAQGAKLVSG
jgi:hypothetical protein